MSVQAQLLVRHPKGHIVGRVYLTSIDEVNVREQVRRLRERYSDEFVIDESQIQAARSATYRMAS